MLRIAKRLFSLVVPAFLAARGFAQAVPQISQLTPAHLWQRLEFSLTNMPVASNPFDPASIRVDANFTLPSGRHMLVPAFWFQAYQRALSGGYENYTVTGLAGWRLRFTPPETGAYSLSITVFTNGQSYGSPISTNFMVPPGVPAGRSGYVRIATNHQYLETGDGQALRLIGENVAWPGGRGTYDYDSWFGSMQAAGENHARVLMMPWAFGIETDSNSLVHYRLDHAWQLDYVLQLAEQRGIYLTLCLDYHGMFVVQPDYWGGNNYWPSNPYNATNGGPCATQNEFFANPSSKTIYQKRLRYLIARYGYSPNLLVWQFHNEIDSDYAMLNPLDVAAWNGEMGTWLHTNDPFSHLVNTSVLSVDNGAPIWSLPQIDFITYHSYAEALPASRLAGLAQSLLGQYGKPVMIEEFGTDWKGWNRTNDLYLRGFRQGIWGGALGGSVGTAMPWWWENIDGEQDYGVYASLAAILNRTGWGRGASTRVSFPTNGPTGTVGDLLPGGLPFNVVLTPGGNWGDLPSGRLAVSSPQAAAYAGVTLNPFGLGDWFPTLRVPFVLSAWLTNNARLIIHLNSVSVSAAMAVLVDGAQLINTNLPDLDGANLVNEEYNSDIPVNIPPGKHLIQITNPANGWFYLDWVRLEQVLPAAYAGDRTPPPEAIGLRGPHESLLYLVAPGVSYPASATSNPLPLQHGQTVTLLNWSAGQFIAEWYDPLTAAALGRTQATTANGSLTLSLPDYREDLAGIIYPPPQLTPIGPALGNGFQVRFDSETGGQYLVEKSTDLHSWFPFLNVTNTSGTMLLADPAGGTNAQSFFRASKVN